MAPHEPDYYCRHPEQYHEVTFHVDPAPFLSPLVERLAPGAAVLDVGCGSGRDLLWLAGRGFRCTGLERSPGLARLARELAGCEVLEADFNRFDFSTLSVDAVVLVGALVHVPHDRLEPTLGRITRALKPGGKVLVTLKEGEGSREDSKGRVFQLWQEETLRGIFGRLGLAVLDARRSESKLGTGEVWLSYVLEWVGGP